MPQQATRHHQQHPTIENSLDCTKITSRADRSFTQRFPHFKTDALLPHSHTHKVGSKPANRPFTARLYSCVRRPSSKKGISHTLHAHPSLAMSRAYVTSRAARAETRKGMLARVRLRTKTGVTHQDPPEHNACVKSCCGTDPSPLACQRSLRERWWRQGHGCPYAWTNDLPTGSCATGACRAVTTRLQRCGGAVGALV